MYLLTKVSPWLYAFDIKMISYQKAVVKRVYKKNREK